MVKTGGSPGVTRSLLVAITNEPFAWAISADNKSIVGADTDGDLEPLSCPPDRIQMCYNHNGLKPSGSIVATCYVMERAKKAGDARDRISCDQGIA